jgi:F-type H+-transporting ATPase subunit b
MPQLDPNIFGGQLFWLAITFVSLLLVLTFVILPRIGKTLSTRQNRLQDDIEAAERLRDQAQAALEAYDEALTAARANAVKLAQEVRA